MVANLLMRGMLAGVFAGLLAFGFARVFGEPQVNLAIAQEELNAGGTSHHHHVQADETHKANEVAGAPEAEEPELVSRAVQSSTGLLTGAVVYSSALGGLFALVFAFALGRFGAFDPRATAALLALIGFIAIILVPGIKYPPNPPAVGNPDTIVIRTQLYFLLILGSLVSAVFSVTVARALTKRLGAWNASIAGGILFIVLVTIAQISLPDINEVSADFPAALLWNFRTASWGMQLVIWTTIGLTFGILAHRSLGANSKRVSA
ncbi:MAG: CbtA family protein [Parvibaculaceae bacterium]